MNRSIYPIIKSKIKFLICTVLLLTLASFVNTDQILAVSTSDDPQETQGDILSTAKAIDNIPEPIDSTPQPIDSTAKAIDNISEPIDNTPKTIDKRNIVRIELLKREKELGLDYPSDSNLIPDKYNKRYCMIERLKILIGMEGSPDFYEYHNEIQNIKLELAGQLEENESQKYKPLELFKTYKNNYELLSCNSLIVASSSEKYEYPIAINNGTIFITLRSITDIIDGRVLWRPSERQAVIVKDKKVLLTFQVGSEFVIDNENIEKMEKSSVILNNITYVTIDYLIKKLELSCLWIPDKEILFFY